MSCSSFLGAVCHAAFLKPNVRFFGAAAPLVGSVIERAWALRLANLRVRKEYLRNRRAERGRVAETRSHAFRDSGKSLWSVHTACLSFHHHAIPFAARPSPLAVYVTLPALRIHIVVCSEPFRVDFKNDADLRRPASRTSHFIQTAWRPTATALTRPPPTPPATLLAFSARSSVHL